MSGAPVSAPLRDRILDAATDTVATRGWAGVTMADLGEQIGVSRQSIYNEVGNKGDLAEALVLREATRFLAAVAEELTGRSDLESAMTATARRVFAMAQDNPILLAMMSSAQGAGQDLLPLLTTRATPVIESATSVIRTAIAGYRTIAVSADEQRLAVDATVRLVLSYIMRPVGTVDSMAQQVGWVAARLLGADT